MLQLAEKLSSITGRDRCLLYPTGWAAGFGVISGLARRKDVILIDQLAHNCLQIGAQASRHVHRFRHNDAAEVAELLRGVPADRRTAAYFWSLKAFTASTRIIPTCGA